MNVPHRFMRAFTRPYLPPHLSTHLPSKLSYLLPTIKVWHEAIFPSLYVAGNLAVFRFSFTVSERGGRVRQGRQGETLGMGGDERSGVVPLEYKYLPRSERKCPSHHPLFLTPHFRRGGLCFTHKIPESSLTYTKKL